MELKKILIKHIDVNQDGEENRYLITCYIDKKKYILETPSLNIARIQLRMKRMFEQDYTIEDINYHLTEGNIFINVESTVLTMYNKIEKIVTFKEITITQPDTHENRIDTFGSYEGMSMDYIKFSFNGNTLNCQRDGFTLVVAPTGGGKTHNAITNIIQTHKDFDYIIYMNLELTKEDIMIRLLNRIKSFTALSIIEKKLITIKQADKPYYANINNFLSLLRTKPNSLIIIDNIDNIKSGKEDDYLDQSKFIQGLDNYLKGDLAKGSTAIVLSQLIKDKETLYSAQGSGKDKHMDLKRDLNEGIVSGAKQLTNNARSVILVFQHAFKEGNPYEYKILKKGSGVFDSEMADMRTTIKRLEEYKQWAMKELTTTKV